MFWLFAVSAFLLVLLFAGKAIELRRGKKLFAKSVRARSDAAVRGWFQALRETLSHSHERAKHHSRRAKKGGKSRLSRMLRRLAEKIE